MTEDGWDVLGYVPQDNAEAYAAEVEHIHGDPQSLTEQRQGGCSWIRGTEDERGSRVNVRQLPAGHEDLIRLIRKWGDVTTIGQYLDLMSFILEAR